MSCSKGHSHYQNTFREKKKLSGIKSKLFQDFSRDIVRAVREGGPDTSTNRKLSDIIARASKIYYPKDKVQESINIALRKNSQGPASEVIVEGICSLGFGLIVRGNCPSKERFKTEIFGIFKRNRVSHVDGDALKRDFVKKGIVRVRDIFSSQDDQDQLNETAITKAEEVAVLVDAEEVNFSEYPTSGRVIELITVPTHVKTMVGKVESLKLEDGRSMEVINHGVEFIPSDLKEVKEDWLESAEEIIDALFEHPDVDSVYDNIKNLPTSTCKLIQLRDY